MNRMDGGVRRSLAGARVLVFGDVMLDHYLTGLVTRVSPEAAVPLVELAESTYQPGGAANVARGIVALGGRALLAGVVGDDDMGVRLRSALDACGVGSDGLVVTPDRPTTTKLRVLASGRHIVRVDHEVRHEVDARLASTLCDWARAHVAEADIVVISDYAKGVVGEATCMAVIDSAVAAGVPVLVDPKGADWAKYRAATVVKPNLVEAEMAGGPAAGDVAALAGRLGESVPGSHVLITLGGDGMLLRRAGGEIARIPVEAQAVFDVTGAGDTAVSALATGLAAGMEIEAAARLANRAAAIAVTRPGAVAVTIEELPDGRA